MAETAGMTKDEQAAMWVSAVLLTGGFVLFLLQLPGVIAHQYEFSPWLYVPGILAMFLSIWKKSDHLVWLAIFWLSMFFMIDLFYGVSFFG